MSLTTSPVTFARLFVALAGLWALNGCVKQVVSHDRTVAKVVGPTVDANKLLQTQVTPEKKQALAQAIFRPAGTIQKPETVSRSSPPSRVVDFAETRHPQVGQWTQNDWHQNDQPVVSEPTRPALQQTVHKQKQDQDEPDRGRIEPAPFSSSDSSATSNVDPVLHLRGVGRSNNQRLALLQVEGGSVFSLREGESISVLVNGKKIPVKVLGFEGDAVVVELNGQRKTVK